MYLCTTYASGLSSFVRSHRLSDFHLLIWLSLVTINMPLGDTRRVRREYRIRSGDWQTFVE